jgi:hypothetical protein
VADDREAAHFVDVAAGVADDPVARDQLAVTSPLFLIVIV